MKQRLFRLFFILSCLFTIGANSYFLIATLIHFGGRMDYAPFKAETLIYRDLEGRDPEGHELYFKHQDLLSGALIVEWHDNWKEKAEMLTAHPRSDRSFYFLTWKSPNSNLESFQKAGCKIQLLGSVSALDASPPAFRMLRWILKDRSTPPLKLFVFKITN